MKNFLHKLKGKIINLMRVVYGMDELNQLLIYSAIIVNIINLLFGNLVLSLLSMAISILFFVRFFSKNINKRTEENRIYRKFKKLYKTKWDNRKTHRVFMCKNCGQLIRVPKGKGKIEVTCPNCKNVSTHRS